ncbi:putative membrane protein [Myroides gitamensis]|uniref:DUF5808 domain-containing protein n=1 Tax=Myroides odoratus TaxID=256 RepID=UPI002168ECE8|nr:DUF5808 domain-containing protein [Myroides odoratus]MCS4238670.1 putative membrane protein [Myroides odoratus]MDH6600396.1 putative membrane protein [Myroides gitamensis]
MNNSNFNDPSNWKWGMFYFNTKDQRLIVPKRIASMGITINFANPWSILFVVVLILLITVLVTSQ